MSLLQKSKPRRRPQAIRRLALLLASLGADAERISVVGMAFGIAAGAAFMATGELQNPQPAWLAAAGLCLARLLSIQTAAALRPASDRQTREEAFYNELPERVSDAVTLIGFGFALDSSPWLGLGAALSAILSAYVRSFSFPGRDSARDVGIVLMDRRQRLVLLASAAVLMVVGASRPLPFHPTELALWTVVAGCLLTVALRWLDLRAIKV
jgi:hypothetical protein